MTVDTAKTLGLQILEEGLDRFDSYNDARVTEEAWDRIYEIGLQIKPMGKRILGRCWYEKKLIEVNYTHPAHQTKPEEFRDTILHELAHHITDTIFGYRNVKAHGPQWQWVCQIIGANPKATYKEVA